MRHLSRILLALGLLVGAADATAMLFRVGGVGVPWLVNVALAKLGLVAALGLAGGAVTGRLARRQDARELSGRGPA